jgi:predicted GNAT family N-acyltransferase
LPSEPAIAIREADWQRDGAALRHIRETVFMLEQQVPAALEWDGADEGAHHLLALVAGEPVGCARLLAEDSALHVGRVAVLKPWRGRGIGNRLMGASLEFARTHGYREAVLDAQESALPFYRKLGFHAEGASFLDAGIPHRHMRRKVEAGEDGN